MTNRGQFRPIETDTMIGNLLHQAEAVVEVDESSLDQRKQELMFWMAEQTASDPEEGAEEQPEVNWRSITSEWGPHRHGEPPLNEVTFLTVAEVASVMRVSKMTVYRLVHNGELPAVRVGRSFRVVEEDVNEYLRKSFYSAG